jgi:glycerol kinase
MIFKQFHLPCLAHEMNALMLDGLLELQAADEQWLRDSLRLVGDSEVTQNLSREWQTTSE